LALAFLSCLPVINLSSISENSLYLCTILCSQGERLGRAKWNMSFLEKDAKKGFRDKRILARLLVVDWRCELSRRYD